VLVLILAACAPAILSPETGRERLAILDALYGAVTDNYWDPEHRAWPAWRAEYEARALEAPDVAAFYGVLREMVRSLGDDHSSFFDPEQYETLLLRRRAAEPPREGIGIEYAPPDREVGSVILHVFAGSPAETAGLRRGDAILAVGDVDVRSLTSAAEVSDLIRGAIATGEVPLEVRPRGGGVREIALVPEPVLFDFRPRAGELLEGGVGYLRIRTFTPSGTGRAVHAAVGDLVAKGARALIVDLRGNFGGAVVEAVLTVGVFKDGQVVSARGRSGLAFAGTFRNGWATLANGSGLIFASAGLDGVAPARFTGPLAVLVDGGTNSAAELVAGELATSGLALIVGERTPGNVEALQDFRLPDGSAVLVAVAEAATGAGVRLTSGIIPDVVAVARLREVADGFDAGVETARRALVARLATGAYPLPAEMTWAYARLTASASVSASK
jgi:carboxyl-terminal processing protease